MRGLPWQPVPERAGTRIPTWINGDGDGVQKTSVDKEIAVSDKVGYEDEPVQNEANQEHEVPEPHMAEEEAVPDGNATGWKLRPFGLTMIGCKASRNLDRKGWSRGGHSDQCRKRLGDLIRAEKKRAMDAMSEAHLDENCRKAQRGCHGKQEESRRRRCPW